MIVADSGLSTIALARGAIVVSTPRGQRHAQARRGDHRPAARGGRDHAAASEPGPLALALQNLLWNMTVAIRRRRSAQRHRSGGRRLEWRRQGRQRQWRDAEGLHLADRRPGLDNPSPSSCHRLLRSSRRSTPGHLSNQSPQKVTTPAVDPTLPSGGGGVAAAEVCGAVGWRRWMVAAVEVVAVGGGATSRPRSSRSARSPSRRCENGKKMQISFQWWCRAPARSDIKDAKILNDPMNVFLIEGC